MRKILLVLTLIACTGMAQAQTYPQLKNADFESGTGSKPDNWAKLGLVARFQNLTFVSGSSQTNVHAHSGTYSCILKTDTQTIKGTIYIVPGTITQTVACTDSPSFIKFFLFYLPANPSDAVGINIRFTKYNFTLKKNIVVDSVNYSLVGGSGILSSPNYWVEGSAAIKYDKSAALPDSMTITFNSGTAKNSLLALDDISFTRKDPASVNAVHFEPITRLSDVNVYPNPANNLANISYHTGELSQVTIELYDMAGRRVARLYDAAQGPGEHSLPVNTSIFNNGLYMYRISASGDISTGKLIISR